GLVETGAGEHPGDGISMYRLSFVRCADDSELAFMDAEVIGRAAGYERYCLDRFDSRASRRDLRIITQSRDGVVVRIDDYDRTTVSQFNYRASPDFNQYGKLVLHSKERIRLRTLL